MKRETLLSDIDFDNELLELLKELVLRLSDFCERDMPQPDCVKRAEELINKLSKT